MKIKMAHTYSWRRIASTSIQIWNASPTSSHGCRRYRSRSSGLRTAIIAPFCSAVVWRHSDSDGQSGSFVFESARKDRSRSFAQNRELVAIGPGIVRSEAIAGKPENAVGEKAFDIHETAYPEWLATS